MKAKDNIRLCRPRIAEGLNEGSHYWNRLTGKPLAVRTEVRGFKPEEQCPCHTGDKNDE